MEKWTKLWWDNCLMPYDLHKPEPNKLYLRDEEWDDIVVFVDIQEDGRFIADQMYVPFDTQIFNTKEEVLEWAEKTYNEIDQVTEEQTQEVDKKKKKRITGEKLETWSIDVSDDMPRSKPEEICHIRLDLDSMEDCDLKEKLAKYWDPETKEFLLPCKLEINEETNTAKLYPQWPEKE